MCIHKIFKLVYILSYYMKTVLCFGNPYIKGDSISVQLAKELNIPNFEFITCRYPDELYNYKNLDEFYIMDVVRGIDKVKLITDLDEVKQTRSVSLHDFDLGFFLKLMKATGRLRSIKIIGIPLGVEKEVIKQQVEQLLNKQLLLDNLLQNN